MNSRSSETERPSMQSTVQGYIFGQFRVDVTAYQLFRDGAVVTLTPKAFDTLLVLIKNRDRAVTKDELLSAVWRDSFVSEDSLTQTVSVLRRALGDDPAQPKFIATVARRGYRFVAPILSESPTESVVDIELGVRPRPSLIEKPPLMEEAPIEKTPSRFHLAWRRPFPWVALTGVLLLAVIWVLARPIVFPAPAALRFTQDAPEGAILESGGILSPDGRYLAFVGRDERSGKSALWVRKLDAAEAHVLSATSGASGPFWSPDSKSLGFFAGGKIKRVGLGMDSSRTIADIDVDWGSGSASWNSSGLILFAGLRTGLYSVPASGGTPQRVTTLDPSAREVAHQWPKFLSDGRRFLFFVQSRDAERSGTYLGSIGSPQRTRLLDVPGTYAPPHYLIYTRDAALLAQSFNPWTRLLDGAPALLADNVATLDVTAGPLASASSGGLLAFAAAGGAEHLELFNRSGDHLSSIEAPAGLQNPAYMPDEKRVLASDASHRGLWLIDLDRGAPAPTRLAPDGMHPISAPSGDRIAFTSDRAAGKADIYVRSMGAQTSDDQLLLRTDANKIVCDWSRNGRYILYSSVNAETKSDLWLLPMFGDRKPVPFLRTTFNEMQGKISPDGRWVAYLSDESGGWEVYLQSFPNPGAKQVVSIGGGFEPHWRGDGRELFYLSPDGTMMSVAMEPGPVPKIGRPRALFKTTVSNLRVVISHYAVTGDGQQFIIDSAAGKSKGGLIGILVNWPALAKP
jgi:DNA-binding winged helix-turn-helix (wHTH) protein/Tol biopolymer transport system component